MHQKEAGGSGIDRRSSSLFMAPSGPVNSYDNADLNPDERNVLNTRRVYVPTVSVWTKKLIDNILNTGA